MVLSPLATLLLMLGPRSLALVSAGRALAGLCSGVVFGSATAWVQELSYGTIGPSLYQFGKLRGYTAETQRYAYGKIYNPDAYVACSNMPRFGHNGILTEQQIKDVTALLMDPASPVNR